MRASGLVSRSPAMRTMVEMMRRPGAQRARQVAGDLRCPADAATARDRNFQDAQPSARRPHLHFDIPAVGHFAHAEPHQPITADGTKRAHVGVARAIEAAHREPGQPPGRDLVPRDAPRLAFAAHARADDEVVRAGADRIDQAAMREGSSAPSPSMNTMISASAAASTPAKQARP